MRARPRVSQPNSVQARQETVHPTFIAYALDLADPANDQEVECADLDEALCHLGGRERITSEMEAPREDGPTFDRYGIAVECK